MTGKGHSGYNLRTDSMCKGKELKEKVTHTQNLVKLFKNTPNY